MPTKRKNTKAGTTKPLRAPSSDAAPVQQAQPNIPQQREIPRQDAPQQQDIPQSNVPHGAVPRQYAQQPASRPLRTPQDISQTATIESFEPASSPDLPSQERGRNTSLRKRAGRPPLALIIILAIIVVICGLFSWQRWFRYSDAQDIQGTWIVADSTAQIVFTEDKMTFIEDTSYDYTIDESAKTIAYSFSNLSGTSHYRFSLDRSRLAVMEKTDGKAYGGMEAFGDDLAWTIRALFAHITGSELDPADGVDPDSVSCVLLARGA